jgi:broad-specificity NMP kinase
MRIAIAGASGTGKTTLARAISEKYQIPVNPVGARSVALEMGFDNPYDVDQAGRRVEFQKRLFESKRDWELAHEDFVTDRTYFDNLTYCTLHMAEHVEESALDVFSSAMRRYDLVFLLHVRNHQKLDLAVNLESRGYHRMYEFVLDSLLVLQNMKLGHPPTRTLGSILDLRVERAFHVIDGAVLEGRMFPPTP